MSWQKAFRNARIQSALLVVWLLCVAFSFWKLFAYANTPSDIGRPTHSKPVRTGMAHIDHRPELVVFLHPHCSCSRATLSELERLLPHIDAHVRIFFYAPSSKGPEWVKSSLWKRARSFPNVDVIEDADGAESDAFGARVSGHVFLYDGHGKLVFSGGITPARGHEGDSQGKDSILSFFRGQRSTTSIARVFGCALKR